MLVLSLICNPGMAISEFAKEKQKGVSCYCLQLGTSKEAPQVPLPHLMSCLTLGAAVGNSSYDSNPDPHIKFLL